MNQLNGLSIAVCILDDWKCKVIETDKIQFT